MVEGRPRRMYLQRQDFERFGYTVGCPGCVAILKGGAAVGHNEDCRKRMEDMMRGTDRSKKAGRKIDEYVEKAIKKDSEDREKKKRKQDDIDNEQDEKDKVQYEQKDNKDGMDIGNKDFENKQDQENKFNNNKCDSGSASSGTKRKPEDQGDMEREIEKEKEPNEELKKSQNNHL